MTSNAQTSAVDTSIFSLDHDLSSSSLYKELSKISQWASIWKISFYSNASKQAKEDVFSRKSSSKHSEIFVNNMPLKRKNTQKHLGQFSEHINEKLQKAVNSFMTEAVLHCKSTDWFL